MKNSNEGPYAYSLCSIFAREPRMRPTQGHHGIYPSMPGYMIVKGGVTPIALVFKDAKGEIYSHRFGMNEKADRDFMVRAIDGKFRLMLRGERRKQIKAERARYSRILAERRAKVHNSESDSESQNLG